MGITELARLILEATPKNMGERRSLVLAQHLQDLAYNSAPAVENCTHAVQAGIYLAGQVERLDTLKKKTIDEMTEISANLQEIPILQSIPGIGIKTAVCLVAELGDIRRFRKPNAINAYIGIDLIKYQSEDF